jgi:hypothetical protein
MKRVLYLVVALSFLAPGAFAQAWGGGSDHINVGIFGNYFRPSNGAIALGGIGARVSVNIAPKFQLEVESSYNFESAYDSGFNDSNGTVTIARSHVRSLDGLIGPKFYSNRGPVRLFITAKGGFLNFNTSTSPTVTFNRVGGAFENLNGTNVYAVFYPGGGAEAFWGPIGIRADVGDEIFFRGGPRNNLRVSIGPTIRF